MVRVIISIAAGTFMAIASAILGLLPGGFNPSNSSQNSPAYTQARVIDGETQFEQRSNTLRLLPPAEQDAVASIRFSVPSFVAVKLQVVGNDGRNVRTLVQKYLAGGTYQISWYGESDSGVRLQPGVYLVVLTIGRHREAAKVVLPVR